MRIVAFPGSGDQYTDALYRELRQLGVEVVTGIYSLRWMFSQLRGKDFVHLHWPSFQYGADTSARATLGAIRFIAFLALIRLRRSRLIWTAHNLFPHRASPISGLDRFLRGLVVRMSEFIVVHGPTPARLVSTTFGVDMDRIRVIHHGHLIDHYPRSVSREHARAELELEPGDQVFLFVGGCLPYKNIETLVQAFQSIERPGRKLLVAGRFRDSAYRATVERQIAHKPRGISVHDHYIPAERMQIYLLAADLVVLPFKDVLTSGSAILALSFGRPVVAPRIGHLIDIIDSSRGVLYSGADSATLSDAMERAIAIRFDAAQIERYAAESTWEAAAQQLHRGLSADGTRPA